MDEGDVIVEIASVWHFCQLVDARQSGPFEDDVHGLVKHPLSEVFSSSAEDRMDLLLIQLIPKPIGRQQQRLMLRPQPKMCDQWGGIDIRPSKHRNPREVVLLILQIKIPKGSGRLQSTLDITCGLTPYDVLLIRKGFEEALLLELLASVEAEVGHH